MTSFYEASTSGLNFDRFTDELFGESTKLRMKQAYWTAKQLFREKLGKQEDQHMMASDAELDTHLERFRMVRDGTKQLLDGLGQMQRDFVDLANYERELAELLMDNCPGEKEHLQRVMQMMANSQALCSKERHKLMRSIFSFYHEFDEFYERAILDCEQTVEAIDRVRLDYRGSLLWMKNCSETLDPERKNSNNLEDFRTVQNVVKGNKRRMDLLKEDVATKVDLLQAARAKMFQECLAEYKTALLNFYDATAAEFSACAEEMSGLESYEIDVLKILNDPIGLALEKQEEEEENQQRRGKRNKKSNKRPTTAERQMNSMGGGNQQMMGIGRFPDEEENDESLIELEDVDVAEVFESEPEMDRVQELLRFDDDERGGGGGEWRNEEDDDESSINLKKPAANYGGLNLLKHANEMATFGSAGLFEVDKSHRQQQEGQKKRYDPDDLLFELDTALGEEAESPSSCLRGNNSLETFADEGKSAGRDRDFDDILLGFVQSSSLTNGSGNKEMKEAKAIPKLAPPPTAAAVAQNIKKNAIKAGTNHHQIVDIGPGQTTKGEQKNGGGTFLLEEVEMSEEELLKEAFSQIK